MKQILILLLLGVLPCFAMAQCTVSTNPQNITCANPTGSAYLNVSGVTPFTYLWSNGSTNAVISNLSAGTYTVTVTAGNGCTTTSVATITTNTTPPATPTLTSSGNLTCATTQVSITTPFVPNITYSWSGNLSGDNQVTAYMAGTYTVTATSTSNGCKATSSITILRDPEVPPAEISVSNNINCTTPTATLTASPASGVNYSWSNGLVTLGTNQVINITSGYDYYVTVTNPTTNCSAISAVYVPENITPPTVTITKSNNLTCNIPTATLTATPSSGVTYAWSGGGTAATKNVTTPGTYTVTVTANSSGCIATSTVTVTGSPSAPIVTTAVSGTLTCATTSVNITATGGGTYLWNTGSTSATTAVNTAGTYTVTVTGDVVGCTGTNTGTVVVANNFSVSSFIYKSNNLGCGVTSATLSANNPNHTYNWNTGETTSMITVTIPDIYTVTVTNSATGCTKVLTSEVYPTGGNMDIFTSETLEINCPGGTTNLGAEVGGGVEPYTYLWSTGEVSQWISAYVPESGPATYSVTVTDATGCSVSATGSVIAEAHPSYSIAAVPATICPGQTSVITASNGTVFYPSGMTEQPESPTQTTTYNIIAQTSVCRDTIPITIYVGSNSPTPVAICKDITLQLDATGNTTPISGTQVDNGSIGANCSAIESYVLSQDVFDCSNVGNFTTTILTVTDISGNTASCEAIITVEDITPPVAICQGYTIQLDATGTANINAGTSNGGSSDNCSFSMTISPDQFDCSNIGANNATLTIIDVSGNTAICTSIITVEDVTPPTAICQDITVQLDATGTADINPAQISNGSSDNCSFSFSLSDDTFDCSNIGANTTTLTVMDVSGNTATCTATVTVNPSGTLALSITATNPSCGDANGTITVSSCNANPPYTYAWSNGATTNAINNLGIGTYTVTVTDNSGTTATRTATLVDAVAITATNTNRCDCENTISLSTNMIDPTFQWNDGANTQNRTNICPGTYIVIVTGANGCNGTKEIVIGNNINITTTQTLPTCGQANGTISANGHSAGASSYNYLWSNNLTTATISNLEGGIYTVTVTSNTGCVRAEAVNLNECKGTISGKLFYDTNQDGVFNGTDYSINYTAVSIQGTSSYTAYTDFQGNYSVQVPIGTYTISYPNLPANYTISTPTPQTAAITANNSIDADNNIGIYAPPVIDASISLSAGVARPGFTHTVYVYAYAANLSIQNATVTATIDPSLTISNANSGTITGNTITWTGIDIAALSSVGIYINVNVPTTTALGTTLTHSATVQVVDDINLNNNSATLTQTVVGSYDPNDKKVSPENGLSPTQVANGEDLEYTIRFQNTGTYLAENVRIVDTLSNNLDEETFRVVAASHPYTFTYQHPRVITFYFNNIMLPDSFSNEPASHGFITYRIKPKNTLVLNDEIKNTGHIFFDFNEAIVTNTTNTVVQVVNTQQENDQKPAITIAPNPSTGTFFVTNLGNYAETVLEIYDLTGRLHSRQKLSDQRETIQLTSGVWFFRAINNGSQTQSGKLIVIE